MQMAHGGSVAPSEPTKTTLQVFYAMLQRYEGIQQAQSLIAAWDQQHQVKISNALGKAFEVSGLYGSAIPDFSAASSRGNKAARLFKAKMANIEGYTVEVIPGAGYPDYILSWDGGWACAELKATSASRGQVGGLRIVLTGSTKRLRAHLHLTPGGISPCHLLITVRHTKTGIVTGMDLDFLNPDSPVNVKLEASTSQRMLSEGTHYHRSYPSRRSQPEVPP